MLNWKKNNCNLKVVIFLSCQRFKKYLILLDQILIIYSFHVLLNHQRILFHSLVEGIDTSSLVGKDVLLISQYLDQFEQRKINDYFASSLSDSLDSHDALVQNCKGYQ
mmetsp:Transcript_29037/g.31669  ORF Transcript_29037/g.31669 Transcript_29037/m.31669 type:complete len:108 (+) Transcript_29037:260-583(+)